MGILAEDRVSRLPVEDDPDDGIVLTALPDDAGTAPAAGLFGQVMGLYEQHGYAAGYRRGLSDALLALLAKTEAFVNRAPAGTGDGLRRVVAELADDVERQLGRAGGTGEGFVEGGLGI